MLQGYKSSSNNLLAYVNDSCKEISAPKCDKRDFRVYFFFRPDHELKLEIPHFIGTNHSFSIDTYFLTLFVKLILQNYEITEVMDT